MKSFTFATANVGSNYVQGRLSSETRHNLLSSGADATVTDSYEYDAEGRVTQKTTSIANPSTTAIQTFTQKYTFDDLGEPKNIDYPNTTASPSRFNISQSFANGLLTGIANHSSADASIASITYNANGLVNVVTHTDGSYTPKDTYAADSYGMARPGSVSFAGYSNCSIPPPQPSVPSSVCPSSAGNVASVPPVGGTTYGWNITGGTIASGAGTATIVFTAAASGSVTLTLTVTNDCGSQPFTLGSIPISAPTATVSGSSTIAPGQSTNVRADLTGTPPWSLTWSDNTSQTTSTSPALHAVSPQTTATYTLTSVSGNNGCVGTTSGSAVITVAAPPPAPSSVNAYALSATSVQVTWSPVSFVDGYNLYRTDVIGSIGNTTLTSFTNISLTPATAYLYYVRSYVYAGNTTVESANSPVDLATTVIFTDDPQNRIRAVDVTDLRTAVNAIRARAGLAAYPFTDSSLGGVTVKGVHIQELRTVLNNARGLQGFSTLTFTDPNVDPNTSGGQHLPVRKVHITELRGGVQ